MAKESQTIITGRDNEILESLDRFPLTPAQLYKLSETFAMPFGDVHAVRRRLRKLASAGLVKAFPYAVASFGSSPAYYQLTRAGYRLIHGPDAELPKRRYFDAIGQARHPHTWSLADLLVHLFVVTHRMDGVVRHFTRENSVSIKTSTITLRPDAGFQIDLNGQAFNFVVELDNGSERVRSRLDVESIERKIRGYDAHSASLPAYDASRYVVLFVDDAECRSFEASNGGGRFDHAEQTANSVPWRQPGRTAKSGCSANGLLFLDATISADVNDPESQGE